MNNNIYTVTFHRANNYGAMLQAYALQQCLLKNNYNTMILDYDNKSVSNGYKIIPNLNKNIIKDLFKVIKTTPFIIRNAKKVKKFDKFRKTLRMSKYFDDVNDFKKMYYKNSTYIVGSDQVWNPKWTGGMNDIYTLNFGGNDIKRISYAASSGGIEPIIQNQDEFVECIDKFDSISVRETKLEDCLSEILTKKVSTVIDPTLLLTKEEWINFAGKERLIKEKYIFTYEAGNPNEKYYEVINELAKMTGYKIVYFSKHDLKNKYKGKKECVYASGPIEWVNLLMNAEYVVTTSFHGTALSTILNKEMFIVLSTLPDRLTSLLNITKLTDRIVNDTKDIERLLNSKINWNDVNKILSSEREKSVKWIINAIESGKDE